MIEFMILCLNIKQRKMLYAGISCYIVYLVLYLLLYIYELKSVNPNKYVF